MDDVITLEITKEDIAKSKRWMDNASLVDLIFGSDSRATTCPIAQALKRKFPQYSPWVTGYVSLNYGEESTIYELNQDARNFIALADGNDDAVEPTIVHLTKAG